MSSTAPGPTQREVKTGGMPMHRYLAGSERRESPPPARRAEPSLMKDVAILFASALALGAVGIGAYWSAWTPAVSSAQPIGRAADTAPAARPRPTTPRPPVPVVAMPVVHADVFFDLNRARLRADAVAVLQEQAARVREEGGTWRVLVQGHADGQGNAAYNLSLAQRRADTVRQFLVELGVPEASIKVLTVGQGATLCDEPTPDCQQLNRRVHLELRRVNEPQARAAVAVPADRIFHEERR